ncbi:MAG: hypothetical protein M3Y17_05605 [Actinomycetota bacterium]|nr:hypothetical protein [Actinomycetota bacterium]
MFRSPLVMFGIGSFYVLVVHPRLVSRSDRPRMRRSVMGTNVALVVLVGMLCWLSGRQGRYRPSESGAALVTIRGRLRPGPEAG